MKVSRDVEGLIRRHLEWRPQMRAADIYKLLYQGVFGVGHILGEGARHRLEAEARNLCLNDQLEEPFIEAVSADGSMLRVNLRPYLRRRLPLDKLFSAMEASAHERGNVKDFLKVWSSFKDLVKSGKLSFGEEEMEELDRQFGSKGCPPQHHSEAYRSEYIPAYRVVKRSVLERIFDAEELGEPPS